jgi:phenylacetate-CoA ligase
MIQETTQLIRIRIVPKPGFSKRDEERVAANLRERVGDEMKFQFETVDHIPRLPNGKFRYVISKVPLNFGGTKQLGELVGVAREEEKTL